MMGGCTCIYVFLLCEKRKDVINIYVDLVKMKDVAKLKCIPKRKHKVIRREMSEIEQ